MTYDWLFALEKDKCKCRSNENLSCRFNQGKNKWTLLQELSRLIYLYIQWELRQKNWSVNNEHLFKNIQSKKKLKCFSNFRWILIEKVPHKEKFPHRIVQDDKVFWQGNRKLVGSSSFISGRAPRTRSRKKFSRRRWFDFGQNRIVPM